MTARTPASRPEGQVEGVVEVAGLSRRAEPAKPSFILPDNDPSKNVFYWKDLEVMAQSAGLGEEPVLPFFVDADDAANPGRHADRRRDADRPSQQPPAICGDLVRPGTHSGGHHGRLAVAQQTREAAGGNTANGLR